MPLSISRRESEIVRVGEDITIRIKRVSGGAVILEIDAPKAVRILRGELVRPPEAVTAPQIQEKLSTW